MLKRKFSDVLLRWKRTKRNECLLVNGARQVGKTFIIEAFGKEQYKKYYYLNFIKDPDLKNIFSGSLEPEEIYKRMSLFISDFNPEEGETLFFLDEIQRCRNARTALKFLAMDDRYDFIASGSLLGIRYNEEKDSSEEPISIPVGYEREIEMHSLDFEEFLWALGYNENTISLLGMYFNQRKKIDEATNERFLNLFNEYMVVGGMPEVVNTLLETSNYQRVFESQQKILKAYEDDILHYAKNTEKPKILACYNSIPRQLSNEYTKFKYKTIERNGSSRKYDNAIDWLEDAGLVKRVFNVSRPTIPLNAYELPEEYKLYATDIGLLTSMFGFETQSALLKGTLDGPAKGGLFENLIFDVLNKRKIPLHYYRRDEGKQEIEFVFEREGSVIPVEVKSRRGKTISLDNFISNFSPVEAFKLIEGNLGKVGAKTTAPHYMVQFL
ncbi:MAG: ATP-binding protein [Spirochaetales bacterium]|nr:ATP-binding protein [Spirochaetales bacterium]